MHVTKKFLIFNCMIKNTDSFTDFLTHIHFNVQNHNLYLKIIINRINIHEIERNYFFDPSYQYYFSTL